MRESLTIRRPISMHYALAWLIALAVIAISALCFIFIPATAGAMLTMANAIYAAGGYTNIISIAGQAVHQPLLLLIFLYAAAPSLAALFVAARGGGGGLPRLLSRLKPIGPTGSARRCALLYVAMLAMYGLGFLAFQFNAGPGVDIFERLKWLGGSALLGMLAGLFIDEGGTLEELGWRGFEWPLLQAAFRRPLAAACVLGVLHWAWHLPREILVIMTGANLSVWAAGQASFAVLCIALSIVAVYCVNRSGGSVWPAIFVHGGSNVWSKAAGSFVLPTFGFDLRSILLIVLALIIALAAGKRLGQAPLNLPA